ncbi:MAG: hypothetical protein CO030_05035 [Candidatus Magasanikbacteria bacterium CG_4_9_14_0_2_um_filter_42_11]|uniref:Septum formation initiator n=1 Tax=Candidatus Magasanikbacteria bacterium CG_4_9_14_0_2_um_filter_42_11 TaxID=1974643 RepID=A0A2M8F8G8_9BACT|nr:MAG: hypothetical protein COU34_04300 [Candidatus Magasanikbacteria bacterium CG10_big_fil_rev_8_21_14_0_10_43_9]PIY92549.1 MAG: hypothetical protein COY70_02670 [Candidatus Magasanikbacteria bacterium CG_4_10_14_0_8_um_filter_42_12]PJC52020.1 MAG: hypothetical protein CO030_05035 [Candidatus Magasanikbacteria bacterium CG_4_9_14_0_2_um_filter_42_11]
MTQKSAQNHSAMRRFFSSRLFLILLFIVAFLVALSYARAYYQDYAIRQEIKQLEQEVQNLQHKKLESFELLKYVSSEDYVEEKARVEFNLKKPGEHVIAIPEEFAFVDDPVAPSRDMADEPLNNPTKWWYYIMHIQPSHS